jgi:hypothetical protein
MDIEQYFFFIVLFNIGYLTTFLLPFRFRKAGYQAIDRICEYYYSLQERSVMSTVEPGYLRKHIPCEKYSERDTFSGTLICRLCSCHLREGEDFQVIAR